MNILTDLEFGSRIRPKVVPARCRRHWSSAVSIPDLLIAATAEAEDLIVLHYDADLEMIAEITGRRVEWVVPRGSI